MTEGMVGKDRCKKGKMVRPGRLHGHACVLSCLQG